MFVRETVRNDLRWYVKKAARGGVALGVAGSGALHVQRAWMRGPRIRALTYHRFDSIPRDAFAVTPKDFETQIAFLAEHGLAISLSDIAQFVEGTKELPDGSVLVTIDDGARSTREVALPILERYRVPGVAFIASALVGLPKLTFPEPYMDWEELRECVSRGLVIGSHSHSHLPMARMPAAQARDEFRKSRELLEDHLGQKVESFAYPYGVPGDFNDATDQLARETGYRLVFNSQHGAIAPNSALRSLPRIKVEGGEKLWMFKLLVRGAMDPWRVIDSNLSRLRQVRQEVESAWRPTT